MKASISKFALLVLAAASAANATPKPLPQAYIAAYTVASCTKTSPPVSAGGLGSVVDIRTVPLVDGQCANFSPVFTSFSGGLSVPCPAGYTPTLTAYPEKNCKGSNIVRITEFPSDGGSQAKCQDIVINESAFPPQLGGQSADFRCQK